MNTQLIGPIEQPNKKLKTGERGGNVSLINGCGGGGGDVEIFRFLSTQTSKSTGNLILMVLYRKSLLFIRPVAWKKSSLPI